MKDLGTKIVTSLLDKYNQHEYATLIGTYLRVFTASENLLPAWLELDSIKKLKNSTLNTDFNVQSEALETMRVSLSQLLLFQELFISEVRPNDSKVLDDWIDSHAEEVLEIFNDIEDHSVTSNYFAVRESMKLEYEILLGHDKLQEAFIQSQKYLVQCMEHFSLDSESITYEAILLFSLFVLSQQKKEEILQVLQDNAEMLI